MSTEEPRALNEKKMAWSGSLTSALSQNLGLAATLGSFLLVSIKLLGATQGRIEPALFLLSHADKTSLLLGTFLPLIPILSLFLIFALFSSIRAGNASTDTSLLIHIFGLTFFFVVTIFLESFVSMLIAFIFVGFSLDMDWRVFRSWLRHQPKSLEPKIHRIFKTDGSLRILLMVLVMSLLVPFIPHQQFWLAPEDIRTVDGHIYAGIVVSTDSRFTYMLTSDFAPKILDTASITQRTPCRLDKFEDRPIRTYLPRQSHVTLPKC